MPCRADRFPRGPAAACGHERLDLAARRHGTLTGPQTMPGKDSKRNAAIMAPPKISQPSEKAQFPIYFLLKPKRQTTPSPLLGKSPTYVQIGRVSVYCCPLFSSPPLPLLLLFASSTLPGDRVPGSHAEDSRMADQRRRWLLPTCPGSAVLRSQVHCPWQSPRAVASPPLIGFATTFSCRKPAALNYPTMAPAPVHREGKRENKVRPRSLWTDPTSYLKAWMSWSRGADLILGLGKWLGKWHTGGVVGFLVACA